MTNKDEDKAISEQITKEVKEQLETYFNRYILFFIETKLIWVLVK